MKILLVDDHRVVLAGLEALLVGESWVDEVSCATTSEQALSMAGTWAPDVAVVDLQLGPSNGLDLIEPLRELVPEVRVLVLTMSADHDDARLAVRRGASGYVLKDAGPAEVLAAIQLVGAGGTVLSGSAAPAVIARGRDTGRTPLSQRERELLSLLAKGRSTDQIARALFLSPKTVRNQLSALYRTLGVTNRAEAVAVAYELGM